MNIYDEAIEKVDWIFSNSKIPNYELRSICVALERAKKVEELLELYRMLVDKEEEYNTSDNTIKRMNLVELLMSLRLEIKALEEEMK